LFDLRSKLVACFREKKENIVERIAEDWRVVRGKTLYAKLEREWVGETRYLDWGFTREQGIPETITRYRMESTRALRLAGLAGAI